jgi:hypothetical protein
MNSIKTFFSNPAKLKTLSEIGMGLGACGMIASIGASAGEIVKRYRVAKYYRVIYDDRANIGNMLVDAVNKKIENSNGLMDMPELTNYPTVELPEYEEVKCNEDSIFGKFIHRITKNKLFSDIRFFNTTVGKFDLNWTPESLIIWAQSHGVLNDEVLDAVNTYTADADIYNDSIVKYERFINITKKMLTPLNVVTTIVGILEVIGLIMFKS